MSREQEKNLDERGDVINEISTWEYLASTLTQSHQQNIKDEILSKVKQLKNKLCKLRIESTNDQ